MLQMLLLKNGEKGILTQNSAALTLINYRYVFFTKVAIIVAECSEKLQNSDYNIYPGWTQ
jgi:hypothetical protein